MLMLVQAGALATHPAAVSGKSLQKGVQAIPSA
jgi:hypothetical protein